MTGPGEPNCPAVRHRSIRAHRDRGCICGASTGGESWQVYLAWKNRPRRSTARDLERWREKDERRRPGHGGFRRFADPHSHVGTARHRELLERTDLACRNENPEIFEIEGIETSYANRARIVAARRVCRSCPALSLCAEVALADNDDTWTFRGGLTPEERYRLQTMGERVEGPGQAAGVGGVRDAGRPDGARPAGEDVDENVVAAFVQERPPRWAALNTAERALLTRELRRRGYTINAVALATHTSHTAVANFWKQAA